MRVKRFVVLIELELVRCLGRLSDTQDIIYIAITSTSDHECSNDSWWPIDCTASYRYIYLLSTLGSATIFGFLRLCQTVADCCKVWHFSRYISLAIWIHSALLSLVSVALRLYDCSYTYSIQGEYEVTSSPAPFCYTYTIYDLTIIVLVLVQGYLYVLLAACPWFSSVVLILQGL